MRPIIPSDRLRGELEYLVAHTPLAKERCRAQALPWLDEGRSAEEAADLPHTSRQSVYNWSERLLQREGLDLRARLLDAPRCGRPPTALGIIDPLIAEVIDDDPRESGVRSTNRTAALLVEHLKRDHDIEVSRRSVSLAIQRLRIRWKRPRHRLALRSGTRRQSKGG